MSTVQRAIFRPEAVQRYIQERERGVLPRFVSPPTFLCLWLLLVLLAAGACVAWHTEVPMYTSAPAIVVGEPQPARGSHMGITVVAFVPPEYRAHLRVGQQLFLTLPSRSTHLGGAIVSVDPDITSPSAVQRRFRLSQVAARTVLQPATVVRARFEQTPTGLPASTYMGSVYQAEIMVGSSRALSLVPLIGHLLGAA
jgi:hypothetical protein